MLLQGGQRPVYSGDLSLIKLLKWLTDAYDLQPDDILRHYDCGGKKCPIYYTEHEDAWNKLKEDVKNL